MQVMSLSCVIVDLLVKKCAWFTSSIAPKHWIVAFKKHVFPVFRNPRPNFIGEGLLLALRSGPWGSRDGHNFFSAILRAESCLVFDPCLGVGAWGGVIRLAAGVLSVLSSFCLFLYSGPVFLRRIFSHVVQGGVDFPIVRSFLHTHIGASSLLHLLRGPLLPSSFLLVRCGSAVQSQSSSSSQHMVSWGLYIYRMPV